MFIGDMCPVSFHSLLHSTLVFLMTRESRCIINRKSNIQMVLMEPCGECGHTQEQCILGIDKDRGYECWHVSLS